MRSGRNRRVGTGHAECLGERVGVLCQEPRGCAGCREDDRRGDAPDHRKTRNSPVRDLDHRADLAREPGPELIAGQNRGQKRRAGLLLRFGQTEGGCNRTDPEMSADWKSLVEIEGIREARVGVDRSEEPEIGSAGDEDGDAATEGKPDLAGDRPDFGVDTRQEASEGVEEEALGLMAHRRGDFGPGQGTERPGELEGGGRQAVRSSCGVFRPRISRPAAAFGKYRNDALVCLSDASSVG